MRVLYLPRWYPGRLDPMPGLFVQRQAEAVSVHCEVSVLYVSEDPGCQKVYETERALENGVNVVRVYFKSQRGLIGKPVRLFRFFRAHWIGFRAMKDRKPDLIHVHVLTREGLIAWICRVFRGTPYVVTEHWSRYFPLNDTYRGFFRKMITRSVVHSASAMVAVSAKLKTAMENHGLFHSNFNVIANPVDMDRFSPGTGAGSGKTGRKKIIHISCFEDKSKNISGFLEVVKELSLRRDDFGCSLLGDGPDRERMVRFARELGLEETVVSFPGLKTGDDLVSVIREADFLVLSSHYETFGSVIIEGLACGTPVVTPDVGVATEVVDDSNGILARDSTSDELAMAISSMLDNCRIKYDRMLIRKGVALKFDNKVIGSQLFELYRQVLSK